MIPALTGNEVRLMPHDSTVYYAALRKAEDELAEALAALRAKRTSTASHPSRQPPSA